MNLRSAFTRSLLPAALLVPWLASAAPLKFSEEFLGGEKALVGRLIRSGETEIQWSAVGITLDQKTGLASPSTPSHVGAATLPIGPFLKKTSRITAVLRFLPGNAEGARNWIGIYFNDVPAGTKSPVTLLSYVRGLGGEESGMLRLLRNEKDPVFSSESPVCKPEAKTPITLLLRFDLRTNAIEIEIDGQPVHSGTYLDPSGQPYPIEAFGHVGFRFNRSVGGSVDSFDVLIN